MNKITDFFNKWASTIMIILGVMVFFNTCGVKGKIERLDRKTQSLELTINFNDSLDREIDAVQREISNLEVSRNVVYDNNTIVRTVARPDDVMNNYNLKIKELQEKLNTLKNARKK